MTVATLLPALHVCIATQTLTVQPIASERRVYGISTAHNGAGSRDGSFCTPLGRHRVRLKIGAGCPIGTIFVGRRPIGAVHSPALAQQFPQQDWILSRILWLQGMEPGRNRGGEVDTLRRFIYIHGTAAEDEIGAPCSHGCIRMRNREIVELFDLVGVGWQVHIHSDWRDAREEMP